MYIIVYILFWSREIRQIFNQPNTQALLLTTTYIQVHPKAPWIGHWSGYWCIEAGESGPQGPERGASAQGGGSHEEGTLPLPFSFLLSVTASAFSLDLIARTLPLCSHSMFMHTPPNVSHQFISLSGFIHIIRYRSWRLTTATRKSRPSHSLPYVLHTVTSVTTMSPHHTTPHYSFHDRNNKKKVQPHVTDIHLNDFVVFYYRPTQLCKNNKFIYPTNLQLLQ